MSSTVIYRGWRLWVEKVSYSMFIVYHEADIVGKKDGQVIMIKNNDQVEAYQASFTMTAFSQLTCQWSTSASTWQQIGQVVDAIGQGRKQLHEGKEYDYVFDVDVSEGMPPLKLPYNVSGELTDPLRLRDRS